MRDERKVIATRMVDPVLDHYQSFFDGAWAEAIHARAPDKLRPALDNLFLTWKEAGNTHRLPWMMIRQMEAYSDRLVRDHSPHMMELMERIRDWVLRELDGALVRADKRKVIAAIKNIDRGLRLQKQQKEIPFPSTEFWAGVVHDQEMGITISGSQNLSYCALYFGYEWFLVSSFRELGGPEKYRPHEERFWKKFNELAGKDMEEEFWDKQSLWIAREARNSIAHLGSKAKRELAEKKPDLHICGEGFISVQANDNHALFAVLKDRVDRLVDELGPQLA